MGIEEKVKAYDEALKQAKKELAACGSMNCDATRLIFRLFPKLRESEDERARKAALEGIEYLERKLGWDAIGNTDILDVKEYLEKQKEQKPVQSEDEREYVRIIKSIVSDFIQDKKPEDVAYYQKIYDWLDRRHVERKEQKPAEWNEEEDWKRKELIQYLEEKGDYRTVWMTWLKSFRPQPKVKLTLLDKKILEAAIAFVQCNDHFNCWGGIDKRTIIKALSSLKPSWKPSEEQMRILRKYVMGEWRDLTIGQDKALTSLYVDLQKLL